MPVTARETIEHAVRSGESIRGRCFAGEELRGLTLRPGTDCTGCNFNRCDARDIVVDGCILDDTKWAGADVTGGSFRGVKARRADFSHVFGQGTDWTGSVLYDCRFDGADICYAHFDQAILTIVSFWRAWVFGIVWTGSMLERVITVGASTAATVTLFLLAG